MYIFKQMSEEACLDLQEVVATDSLIVHLMVSILGVATVLVLNEGKAAFHVSARCSLQILAAAHILTDGWTQSEAQEYRIGRVDRSYVVFVSILESSNSWGCFAAGWPRCFPLKSGSSRVPVTGDFARSNWLHAAWAGAKITRASRSWTVADGRRTRRRGRGWGTARMEGETHNGTSSTAVAREDGENEDEDEDEADGDSVGGRRGRTSWEDGVG